MRKVLTTQMAINKEAALKELERIIKQMLVTRLFKKSYDIQDALLLYVPFALSEYYIKDTGKTKKAKRMQHIFLSTELATGLVKPFADLSGFEIEEKTLEDHQVAYQEPDMDSILKKGRTELLFKILPKNLKYWKEYDIELIDSKVVYRPLWIIRYKLFGKKMRIYKSYGDNFNL